MLGIAPFADLGCTAVFTATQFLLLYHHKNLILQSTRHSANLWQIALNLSNVAQTPAPELHQYDDSTLPVLLMHDNTRLNEDYARSTFLQAVQREYITGPNQLPRLTTTMVRRNLPDSEATQNATSIKHRLGKQRRLHRNLRRTEPTKTESFDRSSVPRSMRNWNAVLSGRLSWRVHLSLSSVVCKDLKPQRRSQQPSYSIDNMESSWTA
jgi:hypothetical protein